MTARILVAGVGNIFLGDDAFGVEVVKHLVGRSLPRPAGLQCSGEVRVVDFGIRGFDLACALLDGYEGAVLVDALRRGQPPGTLCVLEPDLAELEAEPAALEMHGLHPAKVLRLVLALGGRLGRVRILGCEPATFGSEEEPALGLSPAVQAAVAPAADLVEELVREMLGDAGGQLP
jgi:hydrogenase maturation protease